MPEQYTTLGSSTLSSNYTAGSGSLIVTSGSSFPAGPVFRVRFVVAGVGGAIYKVTAVTGTTYSVTLESGSDVNVTSGATVLEVLTGAALNQIRADVSQSDVFANLPSVATKGDSYYPTDSLYELHYNGSFWLPRCCGIPVVRPPNAASWTGYNTSGASTLADSAGAVIQSVLLANVSHMRLWAIPTVSPPYRYTMASFPIALGGNNGCATTLALYESGSGKSVHNGLTQNNGATPGPSIYAYYWLDLNNPAAQMFASWQNANQCSRCPLLFFQFYNDGTTIHWLVGTNPQDQNSFVEFWNEAITAHFTTAPDHVGFAMDSEGVSAALTGAGISAPSMSQTIVHWQQS